MPLTEAIMPARQLTILLWTLLLLTAGVRVTAEELTLEQAQRVFPKASVITPLNGKAPAYSVRSDSKTLGYAFSTNELAPISAYSGKPIDRHREASRHLCSAFQALRQHPAQTLPAQNPDSAEQQFGSIVQTVF